MKTLNIFLSLLVVLTTMQLTSCKKDKTTDEDNDTETNTAEYNSNVEKIFTDVLDITDEAAAQGSVSKSKSATDELSLLAGSCATVTFDTANATKKITIDFGSTNCLGVDNVNRRGQIIASYNGGRYRDSAMVKTITFNNYYVNDNQVSGTKTVTNNGRNSSGNMSFTIVVDGTVIFTNAEGTINWKCNRTREWIAGELTKIISDDKYSITGTSSGTKVNGTSFTSTIKSALIKDLSCSYRSFTQGVIELTPEGRAVRTINYGDGTCDRLATVTIRTRSFNITTR